MRRKQRKQNNKVRKSQKRNRKERAEEHAQTGIEAMITDVYTAGKKTAEASRHNSYRK
jgi:hypothetical protein